METKIIRMEENDIDERLIREAERFCVAAVSSRFRLKRYMGSAEMRSIRALPGRYMRLREDRRIIL